MPTVVRVLDVIKSNVDELGLHLGITVDGDFVVVVREVVQCARGVQKSKANQALAGNASENLARALGIAGGIFDTARWPGSVNAQATCEVRHIDKVLDWLLGNYHGANGLTVDKSVASILFTMQSHFSLFGTLKLSYSSALCSSIAAKKKGRASDHIAPCCIMPVL